MSPAKAKSTSFILPGKSQDQKELERSTQKSMLDKFNNFLAVRGQFGPEMQRQTNFRS
jgi:hypothetical protein